MTFLINRMLFITPFTILFIGNCWGITRTIANALIWNTTNIANTGATSSKEGLKNATILLLHTRRNTFSSGSRFEIRAVKAYKSVNFLSLCVTILSFFLFFFCSPCAIHHPYVPRWRGRWMSGTLISRPRGLASVRRNRERPKAPLFA